MTRYSRLLIDCNRGTDDPTLIMRLSDGAVVPGNRAVDRQERERRIRLYYEPYHRRVASVIGRCLASGRTPVLASIHSYTDRWKGAARPWHAGILWDRDDRVARPLIDELRRMPGLVIGDNEPYSGRLKGDTLWQHGTMRGLAHAIIEIRQDLIADERGQAEWAARLEGIIAGMLACPVLAPELESVRHFGSAAD
jgi:predicted N-formylglutamate amidohydrolase